MNEMWREEPDRAGPKSCCELESELLGHVRCRLQIPPEASLPAHAHLRDLLRLSPVGVDSLDLFEAFARAIVDLDGNLYAELPAFTSTDEVGTVCRKIVQRALPAPSRPRE